MCCHPVNGHHFKNEPEDCCHVHVEDLPANAEDMSGEPHQPPRGWTVQLQTRWSNRHKEEDKGAPPR